MPCSVELLAHTSFPAETVAAAAKLCYSASSVASIREKLDEKQVDRFLSLLQKSGHFSPFEHASFTFGVEGISRVCSHQIVRHRLASYSQQSQRYVAMERPNVIVPPSILRDQEAADLFEEAVVHSHKTYQTLVERGIPKEDARFILPHGFETKIVITMNARELHHFFALRLCRRAQWEIRFLAREMLRRVLSVAPELFKFAGPSCVTEGECHEASPCNKPYKNLEEILEDQEDMD